MSTERNNSLKRDQALNDATSGQMGEEPGAEPVPDNTISNEAKYSRLKAAKKLSGDMIYIVN
jgi:hypothetical protein